MPVECHDDDTPLTFHDTPLFSLLILLVHVIKFNFYDTLMTLPVRLVLNSDMAQSTSFAGVCIAFDRGSWWLRVVAAAFMAPDWQS